MLILRRISLDAELVRVLGTELIHLVPESTSEELGKAKKHVEQIVKAMNEATSNLGSLVDKKKSFNDVNGQKSDNQILFATMRLLGVRTTREATEARGRSLTAGLLFPRTPPWQSHRFSTLKR